MAIENWHDPATRCFGMLLDGRAQTTGIRQRGKEATMLLVVNGYFDAVEFTLPEAVGGSAWSLLIDTNLAEPPEVASFDVGANYTVTGRSLLLFVFEPE